VTNVKLDIQRILRDLDKEEFTTVWGNYSEIIPRKGGKLKLPETEGKPSILLEVLFKVRKALLNLGFEEVVNPIFIDSSEVYRQYGPEAPIILDRIYFLADLPRPDIGLDKKTVEKIKAISQNINLRVLQAVLREYKERKISSDDLVGELKKRLHIEDHEALKILELFEPLIKLTPIPSSLTLRSHMTGAWFSTISEILEWRDPPLYLFSIDWVFRREQRVDESHLKYYHSASIVVVDEDLSDDVAHSLTRIVLEKIGFKKFKTVLKDDTARYYAKGREWEVYLDFMGEEYEVGTYGLYSPISLAKYGIPYPVYNFGIGLERLAQVIVGERDIRRILFPYKYFKLSDQEIAERIKPLRRPETSKGKHIERVLLEKIWELKDKIGPFKEKIYEDEDVTIFLWEPDPKPYAGKATFNKIYVKDGGIISSIEDISGVYIGRYVDFIVKMIASSIERGFRGVIRVKWANGPSDINVHIPSKIVKYINTIGGRIDIKGPVFVDVIVEDSTKEKLKT